jgi:hypothetical protein
MSSLVEDVHLQKFRDVSGALDVSEFFLEFGFISKRIYILHEIPKFAERGGHAHKQLEQIFFSLQGTFQVKISDGKINEDRFLSADGPGILLRRGLWRELMNFSTDAICLVLASEPYEPLDYVNSYEDYLRWKDSE